MGIDGIGKAPPLAVPGGAPPTETTAGDFRVGETTAPVATDLGRLERGEIGLDQYLDARVDEATRHLTGRVTAEQLAFVKATLRTELTSDPVLVELVRRTTGKIPESSTT